MPIYKAEGLGLGYELIPDSWFEAPEGDERDKAIRELEDEVGRLRRTEPSVKVGFLDGSGDHADHFEARVKLYDPLTDEEVGGLMAQLEQWCPMKTDFGPPKVRRSAQDDSLLALSESISALATDKVWQPPSDTKIEKYVERHQSWASHCRETLLHLHHLLHDREPILALCFWAANVGTRPAADALVTVEARGGFQVMPPAESRDVGPITLRSPPKPPGGKWVSMTERFALIGGGDFGMRPGPLDWMDNISALGRDESVVDYLRESARDPNRFFYKPDRPEEPQRYFAKSCRQWRHDADREHFAGEIHVPVGSGDVKGALVVRVEAENLSEPVRETVPVRIETENVSCYEHAEALVAALRKR